MRPYFFLQSSARGSSSRGRHAGGIVLELEDLFDESYMRSKLMANYNLMYGYRGQELEDIIHMKLDEFEEVFNGEQIEKIKYLIRDVEVFRKDIYNKYGGVEQIKHKIISKLIPGHLYLGENGNDYWLYLGKVHLVASIGFDRVADYTGNMFVGLNTNEMSKEGTINKICRDIQNGRISKCFLKGKKRVIKDLGDCRIPWTSLAECRKELPRNYLYSYSRTLLYKMTRFE